MPQSARLSAGGGVQWLFGQCPNEQRFYFGGASLSWCSYLWWVFPLIRIIVLTHPTLQRRPSKNHKSEHLHFFVSPGAVANWLIQGARSSCLGKGIVEWMIEFKRHLPDCHWGRVKDEWCKDSESMSDTPCKDEGLFRRAPHPTPTFAQFSTSWCWLSALIAKILPSWFLLPGPIVMHVFAAHFIQTWYLSFFLHILDLNNGLLPFHRRTNG